MADDDVLIIGKLNDKALLDSIDELVSDVAKKSEDMAEKFETAMNKMTAAMKKFAVSQKVSVDLMKEAWKDMSASFDAMFKAQSEAAGGGKGSGKATYADNTVGALEQNIAELKKERKEMQLNSDELREQNRILDERQRKLKEQTTSLASLRLDKTLQMPSNSLDEATRKLSRLEAIQRLYKGSTELSEKQQKRLTDAIARTKKEIDRINSSKPKTLDEVLGMNATTIDEVTKKMRALRTVTVNPENKREARKLGEEYQKLSRLQAELLGKGIQLTHSNNYLAQSFGYIRNRVVYALTLGAVTNFTKQVYEIRGQYELLERSLGILINDMRKGTEMFNELNAMALKSPFTLMELATGAKQLLAYNFAEEEVVDTTRRLADISAALGVPMERLVYNLGQIKAQTALTARDARDFANAGLAIVPMLAQMYTEEKRFGDEIVTTAQVFDMMSKKMVTYNDVMKVINKVTDEGGKFFDFQAKQADTLRVKMANLTLAWNNMLNEVGQDNQSVLELPLRGLKTLFENWRALVKVVKEVIFVFGAYKTAAMLVSLWNSRLAMMNTAEAFIRLTKSVYEAKGAMAAFNLVCKANPIGLIASAIAAAVGYFYLFNDAMDDAGGYTEKFGKAGAKVINETEALFDTLKGISKESSNYKKVMGELNSILEEYGIETVNETDSLDAINEKRRVAIALIKEETLERKHLNDVQKGRDDFQGTANEAKEKFKKSLKNALTGNDLLMTADDSLRKNSEAIANIIGDVIENNITLIAGKTGEEYQKGVEQIYAKIKEKMRAIKLDESTIGSQWVEKRWYGEVNIVDEYITEIKEAKEAQDDYTEAIDAAYESEKKATESGASFNDRVDQTATQLMKAANDTENFYKKVDQLIKDYSGENIIDFLVKVKTEVPAWMAQKGLTELTQLSARFTALATNAKKAGKSMVNVNGNEFTVQQLFERAAQYTQAAQNKAADIEARKSSTITREASESLKEYKAALEAVNVAKNRLKQGTADQALVTEKETAAQKAYNKALERGVSLEDLQKAKNGNKKGGSKKDPLGDALQKEVQLIGDMQRLYKEYQKNGLNSDNARIEAAKEYQKTLKSTNAELARFGIKGLNAEELAAMDARELRDYYIQLRDLANLKGNAKGVEALEKAIRSLNIEITKIDYKKITDGLNSELGKLKEDYELAVELDANPELGDMFADMMGIDLDMLPHTVKEYADEYTKLLNKYLADNKTGIELPHLNLTKDDMAAFKQMVDSGKLSADAFKFISDAVTDISKKTRKDISDTEKEWGKILEKYAEYESKLNNVLNTTAKEYKDFIFKFGSETEKSAIIDLQTKILATSDPTAKQELVNECENIAKDVAGDDRTKITFVTAISTKGLQESARVMFEEFQKKPEWITATGDLAGMTNDAIESLIKSIEKYKKSAKYLDSKQIKQINNALKNLYKEQRKNNPFGAIANMVDEAKERMEDVQPEMDSIMSDIVALKKEMENGEATEEQIKTLEDLEERWKNLAKIGEISAAEWVASLMQVYGAVKGAVGLFDELAKAVGGNTASDVEKVFNILDKTANGAQIGAAFGTYGAIVGAAVGAATGFIQEFAEELNGNAAITRQVENSIHSVKRLEQAYVDLEQAINKAYGTSVIGARQAALANKELQLAELQRQIQLEKSRDSKYRDEDKILDLEMQYKSLFYEIKNGYTDIVNDLMGTDVASFAENLVSSMIDAFKQGEDYMQVFSDKFDEMIDNMIMKSIVSRVVSQYLDQIWENLDEHINGRSIKEREEYAKAQEKAAKVRNMNEDELFNFISSEYASEYMKNGKDMFSAAYSGALKASLVNQEEYRKAVEAEEKAAKERLDAATAFTGSDVDYVMGELTEVMPELGQKLKDILGEYYKFGESSETQLSALQQGIQGVTEDTAGALEAYMNGVSQQVYFQSDLITQIRDAVVGFDLDVQVATLSQMLLQLQTNYQLMMSMATMMGNWTNAAGNGIRVELLS